MIKQIAVLHLGQKSGLQQRLTQQEESMLNIKAELLRLGFAQQSLQTEKVMFSHWYKERHQISGEILYLYNVKIEGEGV